MTESLDRIADVYGPRTPHPKGTVWPARVDQHLEGGIVEEDDDRWVQSGRSASKAVRRGRRRPTG